MSHDETPTPPPAAGGAPPTKRPAIRMPHTLVVVAALIAVVLVLSWVIPSGAFERVEKTAARCRWRAATTRWRKRGLASNG